jgi:predicted membrane protein
MSDDIEYQKRPGKGKVFAGFILLAVGGVLLLRQFDFPYFPDWLISWPMLLIAWGLYSGAKHNWKNPAWIILIIAGIAFLLDRNVPGFRIHQIVWPVLLISFGLWMILRRNTRWERDRWDRKNWDSKTWEGKWDWRNPASENLSEPTAANPTSSTIPPGSSRFHHTMGDDYLDATSVFSGVKKTILSKDFKGGEIVNIFGGAEIDLTQADINGRIIIDITQVFGGTKILVPSHWQVTSDMASVFAGVDDKRLRKTGSGDNNKFLVLKGVSIFAGVDIRSY